MDVLVHYKRGQRPLRPARPSLLGDGLLERARATSLALLGAVAAVGLAIVALALNQGWPLIAGSSVPRLPSQHQGVGAATVAAHPATGHSRPPGASRQIRQRPPAGARARYAADVSPSAGAVSAGSAEFVVSPSTPVKPHAGKTQPAPHQQAPAAQQPAQQAPSPAASTPAAPAPTATPPPAVPAPAPPVVTTSDAPPEESNVPPWSHGHGHAYGRSPESENCQSSDDHGHGWDS